MFQCLAMNLPPRLHAGGAGWLASSFPGFRQEFRRRLLSFVSETRHPRHPASDNLENRTHSLSLHSHRDATSTSKPPQQLLFFGQWLSCTVLSRSLWKRDSHGAALSSHCMKMFQSLCQRDSHSVALSSHGARMFRSLCQRDSYSAELSPHGVRMCRSLFQWDSHRVVLSSHSAEMFRSLFQRDRPLVSLPRHIASTQSLFFTQPTS